MKRNAAVFGVLLASSFVGCSQAHQKSADDFAINSTVRVTSEDGTVLEKRINWKAQDGVDGIQRIVGNVSGKLTLEIRVVEGQDEVDTKIVGSLKKGLLEGAVRTYGVVGGKDILVSEAEFIDDVKQGGWRAYYPLTGRVRIEGGFNKGKRDGEFVFNFPDGKVGARMNYVHGDLNGPCVVFDLSGETVASGEYKDNSPWNGTFLERLEMFIQDASAGMPSRVRIVTFSGGIEGQSVIERSVNDRNRPSVEVGKHD
jgi:hypothetical protein